jgi:hypothetical protein
VPALDIATLVSAAALIYAVLAALMTFYAVGQRTYPGFKDWVFLALMMTGSFVAMMAYPVGRPPPLLLAVLTNALLVASADRLHRGLARFAGEPDRFTLGQMGIYAIVAAVFTWFLVFDPNYAIRLTAINLGMVFGNWRGVAAAR